MYLSILNWEFGKLLSSLVSSTQSICRGDDFQICLNPLNANFTKWSNTLKQFVEELFECTWPFCEISAERVKVSILFDIRVKSWYSSSWWTGSSGTSVSRAVSGTSQGQD